MQPRFQTPPRHHNGTHEFMFTGLVLLFWAAVIFGLFMLVRLYGRRHTPGVTQGSQTSQTPLDIAKIRYAKGEITKEEFVQLKKDLI